MIVCPHTPDNPPLVKLPGVPGLLLDTVLQRAADTRPQDEVPVTQIFPPTYVGPKLTVIELVPEPDAILAPAGKVHA